MGEKPQHDEVQNKKLNFLKRWSLKFRMMLFGPNSLTDEQYAALHAQASEVSQPVRYAGFIQAHLEPKSPIGSYETALERFLRRQEAQRKVKQKYGARADSAVKDDDFNAR